MSDQKPGEPTAAGADDPAPTEAGTEASTVDAPARWSGSAAVPPPGPKKSRFARRQARLQDDGTAADDEEDWKDVTPVDPWAGLDADWDAFPLAPESPTLPPTRIDQPVMPPPMPPQWHPPATGMPPTGMPPTGMPPMPPTGMPPAGMPPTAAALPPTAPAGLPPWMAPAAWAPPSQNGAPPWAPPPPAPPAKPRKKKRDKTAPPPPPPRTPAPPTQRPLPPPPRRRKRHWGRRFLLLSLLGVVCCCGVPFAYFQVPALRQYPVSAVLPKEFADLQRQDDDESTQAAERLAEELRGPNASTRGVFTGVYGDELGKQVTVFGVTGFRLAPATDVRTQLNRVADAVDLTDVEPFDLGEPGAHERCGVGRVDDTSTVVCAWADHGSLATVLLTRRSVDDSAALVAQLRSTVLTPLR
ncbi:hypothetical protein HH310_39460 [Actinoplanes sp. TBRC 11911]|uniref:hypothetical protein n=1 Tax=Actinoplanes sp. TBRC 11911 TaxID=2729386 RepID=UPI00145DF1EB|nr:hypothetical protein [Actinoplanes sp. TBRC 11911]NMO57239.1 hypothetical protein [Actinoplanes sp. TBRC 11911]